MSLHETSCPTCWRDMVVATCTSCGRADKYHGHLHEISEWLRHQGWKTQPGKRTSDPFEWMCHRCVQKEAL